ncbi:MAG: universal stress protein [FCB group bacterium]|jgi:nucleotide-binding universal stress UspA family protein
MFKIKNILLPTDFSEGFIHTLNYAVEIARAMESELHIIHVIEPFVFQSDVVMTKYGFDELQNELEIYAKKDIEKIVKTLKEKEVKFSTKVLRGKAYEEILDYAKKNHIDMICIAIHGSSNLENLLFGSTTEKVLRKANCPVLTVRIKDSE